MTGSMQLGAYMEGYEQGQADMLAHYSAALDEIYRLRRALAYEAGVRLADLDLKTYPRSRANVARQSAERMRLSACGRSAEAYSEISGWALQSVLESAGASPTLTRSQWEARGGA